MDNILIWPTSPLSPSPPSPLHKKKRKKDEPFDFSFLSPGIFLDNKVRGQLQN
jgi:hypothetical protein